MLIKQANRSLKSSPKPSASTSVIQYIAVTHDITHMRFTSIDTQSKNMKGYHPYPKNETMSHYSNNVQILTKIIGLKHS